MLNVAAGIEGFLNSPSFRPTFPVHWLFSLLGAVGCLVVMFLINALATVVAAGIVLGIYLWLQQRELAAAWGDVRRGLWLAFLRYSLFQLRGTEDPKNWRPHILVLSGIPTKRWPLVELADALTHNRGLITIASILPQGSRSISQQAQLEDTLQDYLQRRNVQALVRLVTAADPFAGAEQLVEIYGLGHLVPNTIVLGDSEAPERRDRYCQMIGNLHRAKRSLVILHENGDRGFGARDRIDIWWGGLQANGSLMLLLAYLLRTNIAWRNAQIFLKLIVPDQSAAQAAQINLDQMIENLHLEATPKVITADHRSFEEILHHSSQNADLIFLGMATPKPDFNYTAYYEGLQGKVHNLPTTLFVLAAPDFAFEEVLTEGL